MVSQYDHIIPIGDHCAISIALKELGIRKTSYPFDWTSLNGGKDGGLDKTSIMINCELINDLKTENVDAVLNKYIGNAFDDSRNNKTNSNNNMFFPHDEGPKQDIFQKYKRRFERLKQDLYKKNVFILITRHCYIDQTKFDRLIEILLSYNRESRIIFISGINHEYFSAIESNQEYKNVTFKYIHYDIKRFYQYDYAVFRPELRNFLHSVFLYK